MAKVSTTSFLLILFCLSAIAAAARTKFHFTNGQDGIFAFPANSNNTLCGSMVEPQGYVCQEHKVTTEDGYILSLQRMPTAHSGKPANQPPVLLQHGIFADGITWLFNSPDESLAFILADNGFDVWISNSRGSIYSQGHTSLTPKDPAYWEWSWDELAAYDLPAIVQYVHDQTGQKLHYVGHSLGTLTALAAFSQNKVLNMLRSASLLSPIAYLNQIPAPLIKIAADAFIAEDLYKLGLREFVPGGKHGSKLLEEACKKLGVNCSNLMTVFTGPNCCLNSSRTDVFLDHGSQPTATKNMIHLAQMVRSGSIAKYDYGNKNDNMNHYGEPTPPPYNMNNIPSDLPLFLGYGGKDTLSDVKDVDVLLGDLKDHQGHKLMLQFVEEYAHLDFVYGVNANQLVYDPLMAFFSHN